MSVALAAEPGERRCPRCGEARAPELWGRHSGRPRGTAGWCRLCQGETNERARDARIAAGLCVDGCGRPALEGRRRCREDLARERRRRRRARRRAAKKTTKNEDRGTRAMNMRTAMKTATKLYLILTLLAVGTATGAAIGGACTTTTSGGLSRVAVIEGGRALATLHAANGAAYTQATTQLITALKAKNGKLADYDREVALLNRGFEVRSSAMQLASDALYDLARRMDGGQQPTESDLLLLARALRLVGRSLGDGSLGLPALKLPSAVQALLDLLPAEPSSSADGGAAADAGSNSSSSPPPRPNLTPTTLSDGGK